MLPTWLTDTVTPDLDRALHYTLLWGLEGVELRTCGKQSERVPYVNEARLERRLDEHEVPAVAVVPGVFEGAAGDRAAWMNDLVLLDETYRFARRLGCPCVVVSAFAADGYAFDAAVAALKRAGAAAARQAMTLAVLNEDASGAPTGTALARLLDAVADPAVRAAWDPAGALQAGEDPADGLAALAGRIALVRARDVRRDVRPDGGTEWRPCSFGEGAVGWPAVLHGLHAAGYEGPVSLEIDVEPRPREGLRAATRLIELLRALS